MSVLNTADWQIGMRATIPSGEDAPGLELARVVIEGARRQQVDFALSERAIHERDGDHRFGSAAVP